MSISYRKLLAIFKERGITSYTIKKDFVQSISIFRDCALI